MNINVRILFALFFVAFQLNAQQFRPPSVPLITFDPYLSIWSPCDRLTDKQTEHWTKHKHPLTGIIRVDKQSYRVMGAEPDSTPALPQVGLQVTPTRTIYDFENGQVHVTLTFMRPAIPSDLDAMALPLNYVTWKVRSVDHEKHDIAIYESTSSQIAVNKPQEKVEWSRENSGGLTILRAGTVEQPVLGSAGDDHRINWGYIYAAADTSDSTAAIGSEKELTSSFIATGKLPTTDDTRMPRAANDNQPVLGFAFNIRRVGTRPATRQVIVAYDEIFAIKYFGQNLRPYWNRNGIGTAKMLRKAASAYSTFARRCAKFDQDLMADATKVGGPKYAQMCALAYRQCAAACGLAADPNKQPLYFTKENTSNGDIATTDVFFPMDPQWLLLSPTLAKATLVPILSYAASWHWKFPNAPHDLGTYPIARGTDDGGEGMPVEESGNMLILCDAIVHCDGNADFVTPWWDKLTQWAEYLKNYGLDPENQLCTDDFMGHLAHNANLSIKAILGLACYGDLCRMRGDIAAATEYKKLAIKDAEHWMQVASDNDHYKLAFDKPNTWSQKYNLVWDRLLGLDIFPPSVAAKEVAHYKNVIQKYGVSLDSRTTLTKTDWTFWSATLANNQRDFEALTDPIYDYLNQTTARSPFVDSYITTNVHSSGMHARPVIGGVFIKMLSDQQVWKKWSSQDKNKLAPYAPLPERQKITEIVPTSRTSPAIWTYTTEKPSANWIKVDFDDSTWSKGPGSFGTEGTPGAAVHTKWNTSDIWLRRQITLPSTPLTNPKLYVDHDEDIEIYANGILAATAGGFTTDYELLDVRPEAIAELKSGANVNLAIHCHQTAGGQNVDVGVADVGNVKR